MVAREVTFLKASFYRSTILIHYSSFKSKIHLFHGWGNPGKHSYTKNAQNAPDRAELCVNTPNAPGARQLHEVTSTVTANVTLFSR